MKKMAPSPPPHFALLPSAGMGHLSPFSRLAARLCSLDCHVTLIAAQPPVSSAESSLISRLLTLFPQIQSLPLPFTQLDPSQFSPDADPFYLRYESIRRSSHLLSPLLSSSSFSALVVDLGLASEFIPICNALSLPCYVFFTTSAAFLSFYSHFPTYVNNRDDDDDVIVGDVDVPGLWTVPKRSVVPFLQEKNSFVRRQVIENGVSFGKADGILVNTFEGLEGETLKALNGGRVVRGLPPVIAMGPLRPIDRGISGECNFVREWLDGQPERSVVYVSFGSRTAMGKEQIKELGDGLEKSQCRYLWVIKTKKVDRDEEETNLEDVLGEEYIERVKGRGIVINGWVEQEEILSHRAVGLFLSHCGWNSMMEAALFGVRVMAWPRGADQRVNGVVVRRSGLGVWMEDWSWEAEEGIVSADEIGKRVKEIMEDEEGKRSVEGVKEESNRAVEFGGSSYMALNEFIGKFLF